ncbi:MAG: polysaccharide biosynthesis tyrosine autokinase [Acidobacteria bacterium]|nr:polysaccharide biosynthesis tyrosine autokinase [Acidobacteriota bacterium]
MTFKQILGVLWLRRWLTVAVVAVALISAGFVIELQPKSFESDATVRTSAIVSDAASNGSLGGVQVDIDSNTATSPAVLSQAARLAGEPGINYSPYISTSVTAGSKTDTILIAATAPTPELAQRRSSAVVKAFNDYLQQQIDSTVVTLKDRASAANAAAVTYQAQAFAAPNNALIAANLSGALATLSSINDEIALITNSGSPTTTLNAPPLGYSLGTSPLLILLVALVAGVIAGMGISLIRDQFDNRLRGDHEIEPLTSLPSLAELVLDKSVAKTGEALPAARSEQTALGEGLRSLRTSMQVLLPRNNAVVAFSSVEPGDGKTFVSANVALAWARTGKRVILVGGDLRRPNLWSYFGEAARGPGLIEILQDAEETGRAVSAPDVTAHLNDTEFRGLRVLPAGERDADPADLLATASLKQLIAVLRALADVIIIDTPPAMALVDASLLAEQSDGVILLANINRTDRTFLVNTLESLRQNGVRTLGVVTNRSRRALPKSYAPYYARQTAVHESDTPGRFEAGSFTEWDHDNSHSVADAPGDTTRPPGDGKPSLTVDGGETSHDSPAVAGP